MWLHLCLIFQFLGLELLVTFLLPCVLILNSVFEEYVFVLKVVGNDIFLQVAFKEKVVYSRNELQDSHPHHQVSALQKASLLHFSYSICHWSIVEIWDYMCSSH